MHQMGSGKMLAVGSRAQVFHGVAKKTSGGLKKNDLFKDKNGRIRSKKASSAAKKRVAKPGHRFRKYIEQAKENKGKKFKPLKKISSKPKKNVKKNKK